MVERLAGAEATLYHRMLKTIRGHQKRNQLRENLFQAKARLDKVGFSVPDSMVDFAAAIGWPEKAVMVPARRMQPGSFFTSGSPDIADELNERFNTGYTRLMERMAIDSSLKHGPAFTFITPGDVLSGDPDVVLSSRSALEATAIIDRRTLKITAALEIVDDKTRVMFLPGENLVIKLVGSELVVSDRVRGIEGRVQCVLDGWGRTLDRPYGRSRITRPVMDYSGIAVRIMLRQEVHAEHFSSPQRVLEGARQAAFMGKDGRMKDGLEISTGSVWGIPDYFDEETGEWIRANLKEITASSMQPHSDHLRQIAMMFSGETAIPVSQLGIIQDNPSSADAIRAAESDLTSLVEAELPNYRDARRERAELVLLTAHVPSESLIREARKVHAPFQDPGTVTASGASDRAVKFLSANPWAANSDVALEMWGFDESQVERLRDERARLTAGGVLDRLMEARNAEGGSLGDDSQDVSDNEKARADAELLKIKMDAIGVARRAGVDADEAAKLMGLDGLKFAPGSPITLRTDEG